MDFKKILIAVDASENARRAVEYTGEIVGNAKGFEIMLLHIARPPERDTFPDEQVWEAKRLEMMAKIMDFFKEARHILESMGVANESISERYVESTGPSISHQILAEQEACGFGTVVVGRRGVSKEEEFLFGSVSNRVVHYAKKCTVWVVE
ncbi:MAG: universal stress protein [Dissulfurimicrobium sp.]|uniref:universal stress protein n=1 Tax=Dissulfurimicrobium TaxID=1769732 RepID=UPI001EDBA74B|nr:universal stress protein [Dissulfurimicrobium hydrothermale]UKL13165.1 universal stress protein [Dissulfurimicrobium hydrothermale]